jgi:hypothetical protein
MSRLGVSNEDEEAREVEVREKGVREFVRMETQNVRDLYSVMNEGDAGVRYFWLLFYGLGIGMCRSFTRSMSL